MTYEYELIARRLDKLSTTLQFRTWILAIVLALVSCAFCFISLRNDGRWDSQVEFNKTVADTFKTITR